MKILAEAFVELAAYLRIARFEDPDEAQGAEELIEWSLIEASAEERALLSQTARQRAQEETAKGSPADVIRFYEEFASRADDHQKYG